MAAPALFSPRIALAPETGAGAEAPPPGNQPPAAAGDGKSASGGPSPNGGGGQSPANGASPPPGAAAYRPEGLPDHYLGKTDQETIDRLYKVVDGFRRESADRGTVPDKPDAYAFEASDKLKPYVGAFDKDPVYAAARDIAHKSGMTDRVFKQFIPAFLEHMIDGGLVGPPLDPNAQLLSLAPESTRNLDEAGRTSAAKQRLSANIAWVDGAKGQGVLPEAAAEFLAAGLASDPRAHHLVEFMRGGARETAPAMGGGNGGGASAAGLEARLNDPRNDPRGPKYEPAFATETDRLYRQQYG